MDISLRSSQKIFTFNIKKYVYRVKVFFKIFSGNLLHFENIESRTRQVSQRCDGANIHSSGDTSASVDSYYAFAPGDSVIRGPVVHGESLTFRKPQTITSASLK